MRDGCRVLTVQRQHAHHVVPTEHPARVDRRAHHGQQCTAGGVLVDPWVLEQELQVEPSVTAGTLAGTVETPWGESVNVVVADDAGVVLWNGGSGSVTSTFDLGDARTDGAKVGELAVDGPLNDATVDLLLADEIEDPSFWWRLTHPLHLFGLVD